MTKRSTGRLAAVAMERRDVAADAGVEGRHFVGHAAVFNQRTAIGDPTRWGFYEVVAPTAFDKTLREADVVMLSDHDPSKPLARTSAGTMTLRADGVGLLADVPEIPATTYGNDLVLNLEKKNVAGMSFGFQVVQDDWATERQSTNGGLEVEVEVRTLLEVRLIEVSTTAFPAYAGTDASVRAVRSALQSRHVRTGYGLWTYERAFSLRQKIADELREGKTLSTDTLNTLQTVLDGIASVDETVDALQPMLAGLMGVPNPDSSEDDDMGDDDGRALAEDMERRRRFMGLRLESLRAG